jgi:pyruvate/2-oxoglutarate dehydrogenase complex dihydrolipoamide dehydrogenase (E3) component
MAEVINTDICVIGAGSGGLSVAAGASQMGASVVLIEKGLMGGDCLNYGCVPSKALLAAGHAAHAQRHSDMFGIASVEPAVDWSKVRDHVKGVIAAIAPHDSVERFEGMGVNVIQAHGKFTGPREVQAGDKTIRAKYIVVATGSSAFVPPIEGLADTPYLTNETIFDNGDPVEHLIVVGGGPIGLEMAQAHRRLGAEVTVIEMARAFGKDDPEAAELVLTKLRGEGVDIREGTALKSVAKSGDGVAATVEKDGASEIIQGSHLLIAVGRAANVNGLDLEKGGIEYDRRGIKVDAHLKTTNKRVFAIGDVAGGYQFTHMAGYDAGIVIRQALFKMFWTKVDHSAVPWVTFTDPELAHVGMTETDAEKALGKGNFTILRWSFGENDRAQSEHATDGMVKAIVDKKGRALGCSIAGPHAGELILPWVMAVQQKQKMGQVASLIAPYPTLSEVTKRTAGSYFTPSLFSDRTKKVVGWLMRWFS